MLRLLAFDIETAKVLPEHVTDLLVHGSGTLAPQRLDKPGGVMSSLRRALIGSVILTLPGCASGLNSALPYWNDTQQIVTIRLNSVPSGAQVYGLRGDSAGTLLGTTPLVLRYYRHKDARPGDPVWCEQCGQALSQETLVYLPTHVSAGQVLASLTWFGREKCQVDFQSILVMSGYQPLVYRRELHSENKTSVLHSGVNCWDNLKGGTITLTAELVPGGR
ncbi:MAG: hypothetical protein ABR998_10565 [Gemmatimonadales bacterium]|jgi:hypothetical protein